jgi:hypothetical protein
MMMMTMVFAGSMKNGDYVQALLLMLHGCKLKYKFQQQQQQQNFLLLPHLDCAQ